MTGDELCKRTTAMLRPAMKSDGLRLSGVGCMVEDGKYIVVPFQTTEDESRKTAFRFEIPVETAAGKLTDDEVVAYAVALCRAVAIQQPVGCDA